MAGFKKWNDSMEEEYGKEGWARRRKDLDDENEREDLDLNLRAVRDLVGKTQAELAELAGTTQSEISMAERRADHLVSTLRRYVEALGGELEVVARFGDKSVKLRGV
jgi:DNA-binding XRE family transcriptional regulator